MFMQQNLVEQDQEKFGQPSSKTKKNISTEKQAIVQAMHEKISMCPPRNQIASDSHVSAATPKKVAVVAMLTYAAESTYNDIETP